MPGVEHELRYVVPQSKIVANLYPESAPMQAMPHVFATGFLVGLLEWTCIEAINPHLDWPQEQTVGTGIEITHEAPTPPGLEVLVTARLEEVDGRRLMFSVEARDRIDTIARGRHERVIIDRDRFGAKAEAKRDAAVAARHDAQRSRTTATALGRAADEESGMHGRGPRRRFAALIDDAFDNMRPRLRRGRQREDGGDLLAPEPEPPGTLLRSDRRTVDSLALAVSPELLTRSSTGFPVCLADLECHTYVLMARPPDPRTSSVCGIDAE